MVINTAHEGTILNRFQPLGQCDACKFAAICKQTIADGGYAIGNDNLCEAATLEGTLTHAC